MEQSDPQTLPLDQVVKVLIPLLDTWDKAHVVFEGFTLPEEFGFCAELQYGDIPKMRARGLGLGAVEMGKGFVKKTIEDLFSGELGEFVPEGTQFRLKQGEGIVTVEALIP